MCDKRDSPDTTLFLVDRKKQRSFWSDRLDNVEVFPSKNVALRRARSLRYNNACVLTLARAQEMLQFEEEARRHDEVMDAAEAGTFGYKDQ